MSNSRDVPAPRPFPARLGLLWAALAIPLAWSCSVDPDLFFHILTGQETLTTGIIPSTDRWSFTAAGNPLMNHQWLAQVLLAWSWGSFGNPGLLALRAVVLLLTVAAMGAVIWKRCPDPLRATIIFAFPLPVYTVLINLRPQGMTYLGTAAVLYLLGLIRGGAVWPRYLLMILFPLWANLHAGFPFGLAIMGLGILAMAVEGTLSRGWAAALLIVPGALTLLNPYGIELWLYIFKEFGAPHVKLPEWNPPEGILWYLTVATLVVPLLVTLARRTPVRIDEWIGLTCAFAMTLRGARFIIFAFMLSAVALASALRPREEAAAETPETAKRLFLEFTALAFVLCVLVLPYIGKPGSIRIDAKRYPVGSLEFLRSNAPPCRLWTPLGWGGIVLFHLSDRVKVSLDGRNTTVYPVDFVVEQTSAAFEGNLAPLLKIDPDMFLTGTGDPVHLALASHPDFIRVHTDPVSTLFARRTLPLGPSVPVSSPTYEFPW